MAHKQILALSVGGLAVLGTVAALGVAPASAETQTTNRVEVTVGEYCTITSGIAGGADFQFENGAAVSSPSASVPVEFTCNVASSLTWVAATNGSPYAPATGAYLTPTGMGTSGGFAPADGTHALTTATSEWGATFSKANGTGSGTVTLVATQTSPKGAPTTAANVATATAGVADGTVTPTYQVSYDGTLAKGDYYGYVLYTLVPTT